MILLKNARIIRQGNELRRAEVLIRDGRIERIGEDLPAEDGVRVLDLGGKLLTPGFIDPHVHLREPGFTDKETIQSGARAAAKGGYTTIFAMPNVSPCPDTKDRLKDMERRAATAPVDVRFFAPITKGGQGEELTDFAALKASGAAALSDDGRGVQHTALMARAMEEAARESMVICAHCEEESLLRGGYVHEGDYSRAHGHRGILRACEDIQAARDILLAAETGVSYHICHISSARTVDLLALGKAWGGRVSGEVTPHHLLLSEADLKEDGRYKMNPPLRSTADRKRLIEALRDGIIEVIATDHAPHTEKEKSRGLAGSPFGVTGLETAFALLYTRLVRTGELTLQTVVEAMTKGPARIFGLEGGRLAEGAPADLTILDLSKRYRIDASRHESKGRNTPFDGAVVYGAVDTVIRGGRVLIEAGEFTAAAATGGITR